MVTFLDSCFIVPLLIEHESTYRAEKLYSSFNEEVTTSISVFEEVAFIGCRLLAQEMGLNNAYRLAEHIEKEGHQFAEEFFVNISEFFADIQLVEDSRDVVAILLNAQKYRLLTNDALIVTTCQHQGISQIASFDRDFQRVDNFVVIPIR